VRTCKEAAAKPKVHWNKNQCHGCNEHVDGCSQGNMKRFQMPRFIQGQIVDGNHCRKDENCHPRNREDARVPTAIKKHEWASFTVERDVT
jgi:hypothetical protein